jgi:hypothetical protein
MKLDKSVVQRRLDLMGAEGIVSDCSCYISWHLMLWFRLLFQMPM